MNDRKLIDYLPPVLRSVMEFMAITDAQQPEFERAWAALNLVMDNQFIDTATEEGVAVWEKELNITPLNTETLEARKKRIKTAWAYGVVYTYNWLVNWLKTSCGEGNPRPTIDGYVLHTYLPAASDYMQMLDNMRRYVPENMLIDPKLCLAATKTPHYFGAAFAHTIKITMHSGVPDTKNFIPLTDENGVILTDENNKLLLEEKHNLGG